MTPEYYPRVRAQYPDAVLVGHTVWETDRLPQHWPDLLELPDLLIVPCRWNAEVIGQAGVSTPVRVVPHVADTSRGSSLEAWPDAEPGAFLFYTIASWTARKAVWNTVRAYQLAFTRDDPVHLVIKTNERDHTVTDVPPSAGAHHGTTSWALARLLGEFAHPASMELVTRQLRADEMRALHVRGDCYVSLCRSEGWGLTAFDAATVGTPVVITGFGGHLDYLDDATALLVDYELVSVDDPAGAGSYTPDQTCAEPSVEHAARLMRAPVDDPAAARARAAAARRRIRERYAPPQVAAGFLEALESTVSPQPSRRR